MPGTVVITMCIICINAVFMVYFVYLIGKNIMLEAREAKAAITGRSVT